SKEEVKLVLCDAVGTTVNTLRGQASAGIHTLRWNLRGVEPPAPAPAQGQGQGRNQGRAAAPALPPGDYVVKLMIGARQVAVKKLRIEADNGAGMGATADDNKEETDHP